MNLNKKKVQKTLAAVVAACIIGMGVNSYTNMMQEVKEANFLKEQNKEMIDSMAEQNQQLLSENDQLKANVELLHEQNESLRYEIEVAKRSQTVSRGTGRSIDVEATAYTLGGNTAMGFDLTGLSREDAMVIAVDPDVIPLGSQVYITFDDAWSEYNGVYTASDTGGAINGNIVDVFVGHGNDSEAMSFGRRSATIEFL